MKVTVGKVTDRGLNPKRPANEDRLLVLEERGVFIVADGVGGRRGGQVASQTVVDVFAETFAKAPEQERALLLEAAIIEGNRRIFQQSLKTAELEGMATTVVALVIDGDNAIIGHVGDSRLYRFQNGVLAAQTEDHSEVVEAVRAGAISPAMAAHDPLRNVLTRAIGAEPDVEADIKTISLLDGARFLLCSDGITRHIPDASLHEILAAEFHPQEICDLLKAQCYRAGAQDNLTAVVVDVGEAAYRAMDAATASLPPSPASPASPATRIEVDFRSQVTSPSSQPTVGPPRTNGSSTEANAPATAPQRQSHVLRNLGLLLVVVIVGVLIGRYYDRAQTWVMTDLVGGGATPQTQPRQTTPVAPDPDFAAARVLFEERRYEKARDQLAELVRRSPENAEYRLWRGRSEYELKNYAEAITDLNEAARLDQNLTDVYEHLARAYGAVGDRRNMEESLRRGRLLNNPGTAAGAGGR